MIIRIYEWKRPRAVTQNYLQSRLFLFFHPVNPVHPVKFSDNGIDSVGVLASKPRNIEARKLGYFVIMHSP